ncbi:MAG: hypothetical protein MI919_17635, partial [Holophagales bacterium]|nr:hypothetical protein [Holophagales bacterium]
DVTTVSDLEVRLEVPRARVARAATAAMELLDVADLVIEEEPLGHVIERLQQARGEGIPDPGSGENGEEAR